MKTWAFALLAIVGVGALAMVAVAGREAQAAEQKSGLSGVRVRASKSTLEKIAREAAKVRWTQSSFDTKGRLTLKAPDDYTSDDFGRLLDAIDPYKSEIRGLQMLGPEGGPVDDKGIDHPDE
jgi:hypothetical protein